MFAANEGVTPNDKLYVDDVFSTFLYTGNGSTQTINNGIDLAGKGGLVWIKQRSPNSYNHALYDTVRGAANYLRSDTTNAAAAYANSLTAFNSSGFSLGSDAGGLVNQSNSNFVSWTFRKAPKFFDVVTYTGDGVAGRQIAHNLGVAPGMIIVKKTNVSGNGWTVYHRSTGNNQQGWLNATDQFVATAHWNTTTPDATSFYVGSNTNVNNLNDTYVAYLFAHDPSADGIIQCGSYSAASGQISVTLGFEPQILFIKRVTGGSGNWVMVDTMRGMTAGLSSPVLYANASNAESAANLVAPTATGFTVAASGIDGDVNTGVAGNTYIYLAIRRPNKPPTTGTQVYNGVLVNSSASAQTVDATFPTDLVIKDYRNLVNGAMWFDRLRGLGVSNSPRLLSSTTGAEATSSDVYAGSQTTVTEVGIGTGYTSVDWFFRRAPGFFDVVCYTGTGVARTVNHNLGVVPELMIVKCRSKLNPWVVYPNNPLYYMNMSSTSGWTATGSIWNSTSPTAAVLSVGTNEVNEVFQTFVAYLFASLPGISKVGSYTGNGTSQTINCGFASGARFILIKRTDSTGDWYVWDSARGIVAANDPHLSLNTTAPEVTTNDSVDPDSSGFIVNQNTATNINVSGASYIFLAIA